LLFACSDEFALQRVAFGSTFVEFAVKFGDGSPKIGDRFVRHNVHWQTLLG
jgi:hypothetical protein